MNENESQEVNSRFGIISRPVPVRIIGIPDRYGESGDPELLYKACHMDADSIVEEALKLKARK